LDPFAPGHTDEEKTKIWARINELVGDTASDDEDDDEDDEVERVSFSGSENENSGEAENSDVDSEKNYVFRRNLRHLEVVQISCRNLRQIAR